MEIPPYYQQSIECIFCKQNFKTTKIRSKFIKVEHHETDFQPIYQNKEINPLLYNVYVCEHCGFSFTKDFTKYFAPGVKNLIKEQVANKWVPHSFGHERSIQKGIIAYKLGHPLWYDKKRKVCHYWRISFANSLAIPINRKYRARKTLFRNCSRSICMTLI